MPHKKLLLIDHFDSFSFNLVHGFERAGAEVLVANSSISVAEAAEIRPDFLVFSPGPGAANVRADIGNSPEIFAHFLGQIPILGVCLGFQMIGHFFGARIDFATPAHGLQSQTFLTSPSPLFQNFPSKISTARYHSQILSRQNFPSNLEITAHFAGREKIIAAFEDKSQRIFGLQFHPESVGTPRGQEILENFLHV